MDYIGATPQSNPIMGLLAERLKQAQQFATRPFGYQNPPAEMLLNLLGVPAVQQTAERLAYGEPLTTGRGMTTQIRPEVAEAALTVAPVAGLLGKATKGLPVGVSIKSVDDFAELASKGKSFKVTSQDASEIFGEGAKRIRYQEPNSQGFIDVLQKPDGTASVLGLEVPEIARGKGIGQSLQAQVMQDFPEMMGQVSSKAAATTAYRLGRRPVGMPNASLEDVFKMIDEDSSVNLVSPEMQNRFGGLLGQSKALSVSPVNSAESNARKAIENLMNQARYFGVDSPIDYTNMPVGAVMQDLDSYLGMSKQVADLPDVAKTSLRNLWYKAEDAANAYKRVYGENKLMGKPEEAANDARKNPMLWDEKKLKKLLKDGTFTQDEYENALEWNRKHQGLLD